MRIPSLFDLRLQCFQGETSLSRFLCVPFRTLDRKQDVSGARREFVSVSPQMPKWPANLLPSISAWPYLDGKGRNDSASALVLASDNVEGFPHLHFTLSATVSSAAYVEKALDSRVDSRVYAPKRGGSS